MNTAAPWDYLEMARHLHLAGVLSDPAEAHGIAFGLTAASNAASLESWQTELHADRDTGDARVRDCQQSIAPLYLDAKQQQATASMPELCLPPDDQDICARAEGFRNWCRGFLYGLGLSGRCEPSSLSSEANEALGDIGELANLDANQPQGGEEDEAALAELQEYLRVAVSIIRDDIRSRVPKHK